MLTYRNITEKDRRKFNHVYAETVQSEFPEYSQEIRDYFSSKKHLKKVYKIDIKIGAFYNSRLVGYVLTLPQFDISVWQ